MFDPHHITKKYNSKRTAMKGRIIQAKLTEQPPRHVSEKEVRSLLPIIKNNGWLKYLDFYTPPLIITSATLYFFHRVDMTFQPQFSMININTDTSAETNKTLIKTLIAKEPVTWVNDKYNYMYPPIQDAILAHLTLFSTTEANMMYIITILTFTQYPESNLHKIFA